MDYNGMSTNLGAAAAVNRLREDRYDNMTDDEKREYVERHRNSMSKSELDEMLSSIGKDEEPVFDLDHVKDLFNGPSIG